MAEVIARDLLGAGDAVVGSAGVSAGPGAPATPEAVAAVAELGLDLGGTGPSPSAPGGWPRPTGFSR